MREAGGVSIRQLRDGLGMQAYMGIEGKKIVICIEPNQVDKQFIGIGV